MTATNNLETFCMAPSLYRVQLSPSDRACQDIFRVLLVFRLHLICDGGVACPS
jgi:hypothetical protein